MSNLALAEKIENVLINGDLKNLSPEERILYYNKVCVSVGLNSVTRPLEFITLNGKLVLYARKDATDQLRKIHNVSIDSIKTEQVGDLFVVTAMASIKDRKDSATGILNIANLKGEALANALMKAETKAKRRVTLSICGLGILDETEVEDADKNFNFNVVEEAAKRFEEPIPLPKVEESERQGFVAVKTNYTDRESRDRVTSLGFAWDKQRKVWIKAIEDGLIEQVELAGLNYELLKE